MRGRNRQTCYLSVLIKYLSKLTVTNEVRSIFGSQDLNIYWLFFLKIILGYILTYLHVTLSNVTEDEAETEEDGHTILFILMYYCNKFE